MGYVEFAPYYYTNAQGKAEGHLIDLSKKIADMAGYQLEYRALPARRAGKMLISGDIDIWFGLPTIVEESTSVLVSDTVVDNIHLRAYRLKSKPLLANKKELDHKKIVILRGYKYDGWIDYIKDPKNNVRYFTANNREQALHILAGRNADYLLDYKLTLPRTLANIDFPTLDYNDLFSIDIHILVSKKLKNAKTILHQFEKAFSQLGNTNPVLNKNTLPLSSGQSKSEAAISH
tara:strand:+ start:134762 stop:135460 length:699 start_codon:yes stop_codon:yes gene_type:complete